MKFITQNIRWQPPFANRFKRLAKSLFETKAEVILLQEMVFNNYLRYFYHQDYNLLFADKKTIGVFGGLATLVHKSIPIKSVDFHVYQAQGRPISVQIADRFVAKGFLVVELASGLKIINTHILSAHTLRGFFTVELMNRNQKSHIDISKHASDAAQNTFQLSQIQQLNNYLNSNNNFVLGGDLNILPQSFNYRTLLDTKKQFLEFEKKIVDVSDQIGSTFLKLDVQLDYFITDSTKKAICKTLSFGRNHPSDHLGVMLDLKV